MPVGELKFKDLRDAAKEELTGLLSKIAVGGDKAKGILIEPHLHTVFNTSGLTDDCFTQAAGVSFVSTLEVRGEANVANIRSLVILVRPSLPTMKLVATVINIYNSHKPSLKFHVLFVPKKTFICCHMLENEYRLAAKYDKRLEIDEFEMDFIQIEEDVLSMEQPYLFRDIFMEGDTTALQYVSKALVKLQTSKIGLVPRIIAKGSVAVKALTFLRRMVADVGADFMQEQASQVDRLYIVDRGVDLVTPLASQLTYEGVIDEAYTIECGTVKPPFEVPGMKPQAKGVIKLQNNIDEVFYSLRDLNFSQVGTTLHQKSMSVKAAYDRRNELSKARDIKDFLTQIPERHRLVGVHTAIATQLTKLTQSPAFRKRIEMEHNALQQTEDKEVIEYVDDLLNKGEPVVSVLRFLCLMSVTGGGLKPKLYETLRESFMLSYGIPQTLAAWYNLERCGLLTKNTTGILAQAGALATLGQFQARDRDGRVPFSTLRKACRLWVENLNEKSPTDVAYAYSGYAPLLLRVIEAMDQYSAHPSLANATGGSAAGSAVTRDTSKTAAAPPPTGFPALDQASGDLDVMVTGAEVAGTTKTVIVFVIGGMTLSEISAIRMILGQSSDSDTGARKTQYIIATTAIINGSKLMESLIPFDAK